MEGQALLQGGVGFKGDAESRHTRGRHMEE